MKLQRILNKTFLMIMAYCFPLITLGQDSGSNGNTVKDLDLSDMNLKRLWKLEDFYSSQTRKTKIPPKLMERYQTNFQDVTNDITQIKEKRINYAKKVQLNDPTLLTEEQFKFQMRDMDQSLKANDPVTVYAHEVSSLVFNIGVTYLGIEKYSQPVIISCEKVFNENWSAGLYAGHFIEKIIVDQEHPEKYPYMTGNKENYKHNYFTFGARGGYHFFKPLAKYYNIRYFDPYVYAMLGYGLYASTTPFLDNKSKLPGGAYSKPVKEGINYGAFGGVRYMYDRNLGFFLEAGYSNTGYVTFGITLRFPRGASILGTNDVIEFKVLIATSKKPLSPDSKKFEKLAGDPIEEYHVGEFYKYTVKGDTTDYASAQKKLAELKTKKVTGAELMGIFNGEPTKLKTALKLYKKQHGNDALESPKEESPKKENSKKEKDKKKDKKKK